MSGYSSRGQLDDFGRKIRGFVEQELHSLGHPSTTWTIVQTGEIPHPTVTLLLPGRTRVFQIDYEEQAFGTTDDEIREKVRRHLEFAFRDE